MYRRCVRLNNELLKSGLKRRFIAEFKQFEQRTCSGFDQLFFRLFAFRNVYELFLVDFLETSSFRFCVTRGFRRNRQVGTLFFLVSVSHVPATASTTTNCEVDCDESSTKTDASGRTMHSEG